MSSTNDREPRDRRVQFFLVAALMCVLLYLPTPHDMRWVPLTLGSIYAVLAGLTALDRWSKGRSSSSST